MNGVLREEENFFLFYSLFAKPFKTVRNTSPGALVPYSLSTIP
jgi:hypothetical protein